MTLANFSLQTRWLEFLGLARTSVGYCHVDSGCRIAISGLHGTNGIARAQNGSVYVGSSKAGQIRVYEEQNDQSLVLTDIIALGASMIIWGHGDQDTKTSSRPQIVSWTISPSIRTGHYGQQDFLPHCRGSPRIMTRRKWRLRLRSGSRKTQEIRRSLGKS